MDHVRALSVAIRCVKDANKDGTYAKGARVWTTS